MFFFFLREAGGCGECQSPLQAEITDCETLSSSAPLEGAFRVMLMLCNFLPTKRPVLLNGVRGEAERWKSVHVLILYL